MVCSPSESVDVSNESPLPMMPSTSEIQDIPDEMTPSSVSVAVPANCIV